MFRSLFIGFLILSALASKGAGVQIDQNTTLPADMLLNLYNAALAYADRPAGYADVKNNGTLLNSNRQAVHAIRELLRSSGHDSSAVWIFPDNSGNNPQQSCLTSTCPVKQTFPDKIYAKGSDLSPPC